VAWLGYRHPFILAAVAGVLALVMGIALEQARLKNEIGFYFGRAAGALSWVGASFALVEGLVKALLAAVVTLVTFSGTDASRLHLVAIVFGVCVFAGSSLLRRLSMSLGANPARWGYFRLAAPLGLLYSAAVSFLPHPSMTDVGRRLIFDTPARPNLAQASELLFVLKQKFDDIVVGMLSQLMPLDWAKVVGILVSVNMLTGFAIAVFAVAIAESVRRMEEAGPG
jgi:ABC-type transport system involved in multi-copper enzyme maturation permease subunit